jgi:hypothetical protein
MINKKGNIVLDETEMDEIEQYMDRLARSPNEDAPLPAAYIYLHCGIVLNSLSLFIINESQRAIFSIIQ